MSYHTAEFEGRAGLIRRSVGDHVPGMVGFDFRFLNGDHHLARIIAGGFTYDSAGRGEDSYLLGYSDKDYGVFGSEDDDPNSIVCTYWNLNRQEESFGPLVASTVRGTDRRTGELVLPVSDVEDDDRVILRGFEIEAPSGRRNHHVRALGVRFDNDAKAFRITFRDNSPNDDEFEGAVHYFVVPHRSKSGTDIPLFFSGMFSREVEFRNSISVSKNGIQGVTFLSGFHFEFQNDDRHIERIAIDLQDIRKIELGFSAHNPRRQVTATVDYLELSGYII